MNEKRRKKVPFFCRNSILKKSKLRSMLQDYAMTKLNDRDIHTIKGFPSCYEDGLKVFTQISHNCINKYKKQWLSTDNICKKEDNTNINSIIDISSLNAKKRKCLDDMSGTRESKRAKMMNISYSDHLQKMKELELIFNKKLFELQNELRVSKNKCMELTNMNLELQRQLMNVNFGGNKPCFMVLPQNYYKNNNNSNAMGTTPHNLLRSEPSNDQTYVTNDTATATATSAITPVTPNMPQFNTAPIPNNNNLPNDAYLSTNNNNNNDNMTNNQDYQESLMNMALINNSITSNNMALPSFIPTIGGINSNGFHDSLNSYSFKSFKSLKSLNSFRSFGINSNEI